jgi:TatD DNase family protein
MRFIDIGVNLMHHAFDADREAVVRSAAKAGAASLIITGVNEQSSREAARYAAAYNAAHPEGPVLYATAGVHPHDAKTCGSHTIPALRSLAATFSGEERKIIAAIGECGLDYNRDFSPRDVQRKWFERQMALAAELALPLFLHERDAFPDFAVILEANRRGIPSMAVHCFTGTEAELTRYLELGCYIGLTGWICDERRGAGLAALAGKIPSDRMLLETDAPFLIPRNLIRKAPLRSGRNEPACLPPIAAFIARLLDKPLEILAEECMANTRRFFNIP